MYMLMIIRLMLQSKTIIFGEYCVDGKMRKEIWYVWLIRAKVQEE